MEFQWWEPGLVLRDETLNQEVVSSNPSAGYLMDTFHILVTKVLFD